MISARIAGISRLRIDSDGPGVFTLVPFSGCHLGCAYCLNEELRSGEVGKLYDPEALLDKVRKDDIYFRASGGGITFGGGEPLLQSEFIRQFAKICPPHWTIAVETSLNVPEEHLKRLLDIVDLWFVDIKDMNPDIYREYTGASNENVIRNLGTLSAQCDKDKVIVRVPRIKDYNTPEDVARSIKAVRALGFNTADFDYIVPGPPEGNDPKEAGTCWTDGLADRTMGAFRDHYIRKIVDTVRSQMTMGLYIDDEDDLED